MEPRTAQSGRLTESLLIAVGGALGALARNGIEALQAPVSLANPAFPWATLAINTAGSFLLGLLLTWSAVRPQAPAWIRPLGGIGFCGAFTTFSAVTCEILFLGSRGLGSLALVYLATSLLLGVSAAAAGEWVAKSGNHG
jgi:CrcB protein